MRPARSALQSGQVIGIKTVLPAVEGLGDNPVVPAGLPDVPTPGLEIEPTESPGRILGDCPLPDQGCDEVGPRNNSSIRLGRMEIHGPPIIPQPSLMYPNEFTADRRHAPMSSPSDEATIGEKQELVDPGQGTPPDEFEKINVDTPLPELEIRVKMTGLDGEHVSWLLGKALSVVLSPVPDDRWS